ncbi:MAG: ribosome maturation factor RimP [Oscillospiraceae bacterium]
MPGQKKPNTVQIATEIMEPVVEELGLELWDVRFEKEGSQWYLRYFIEKEGGVTIQDCEDASRAVDKLLDARDPIPQSYIMEVGSPGIERELVKDLHFQRYIGEDIHVRLIRPVEGVRDFYGVLLSKEGNVVTIRLDEDNEMQFEQAEASYVKLHAVFDI